MGKKLFIGNLNFTINDSSLSEIFSPFGTVESAKVITDRDSGRSKGFGFVEMSSSTEASEAIDGLNGKDIEGRALAVSIAKPMAPRENRGGGGFGGGRRSRF
ncbi:MAG: RNA-binding protein [Oligoflexia bacterium]|nr:RNA-binding protein [Oligoflexia bacterium]